LEAAIEEHGSRYRVRYRRAGHIVTDSTHQDRTDATAQASRLNTSTRDARRHYTPAPAPRLDDWVTAWLQALVHISATHGALHEDAGHQHLGPPKTPAAVRDIALPPCLIDGLERLDNLQQRWLNNRGYW
jgi:hypothetical protein